MFSVNLLQKQFQAGRFEQILDGIVASGMALPLPLRIRLAQSSVGPVALGLRRMTELTYGPTKLGRTMVQYLLTVQELDGSFGDDPLATAAAAAGLIAFRRQSRSDGDEKVDRVIERALGYLAQCQVADPDEPGFCCEQDRHRGDRALTGAMILLLLITDDCFRQAVRFADLIGWYECHEHGLDPDTRRLWTMALNEARQVGTGHDGDALTLAA